MSPTLQTVLALVIVALAATWLVRRVLAKRSQGSCGPTCGAVSPAAKRLHSHLRRK